MLEKEELSVLSNSLSICKMLQSWLKSRTGTSKILEDVINLSLTIPSVWFIHF